MPKNPLSFDELYRYGPPPAPAASKPIKPDKQLTLADQEWLNRLNPLLLANLNNPNLTVSLLARELFISSRQLQRRINELTGYSPNAYIREIRLLKAYSFLKEGRYSSIKETAQAVGLRDSRYFSEQFSLRFGHRPSETKR